MSKSYFHCGISTFYTIGSQYFKLARNELCIPNLSRSLKSLHTLAQKKIQYSNANKQCFTLVSFAIHSQRMPILSSLCSPNLSHTEFNSDVIQIDKGLT
jgi:hypothetical protein